jgi:hypothetical protein
VNSDDEGFALGNHFDVWNKKKKEFANLMAQFAGINSLILGIGTPQRHASYILGR